MYDGQVLLRASLLNLIQLWEMGGEIPCDDTTTCHLNPQGCTGGQDQEMNNVGASKLEEEILVGKQASLTQTGVVGSVAARAL